MATENPAQPPVKSKAVRDFDYTVVAMDGAYCHLTQYVSELVFFQDVRTPPPPLPNLKDGEEAPYAYEEKIERTLKFEVRVPTSAILEIAEGIISTVSIHQNLDIFSAEKGNSYPDNVDEREYWIHPEENLEKKRHGVTIGISREEWYKIQRERTKTGLE